MLVCLGNLALHNSNAETFQILKVQSCDDVVSYTTGEQYVSNNNGVPDNKWSMLSRWQGPKSHSSFVVCGKGEININTWQSPHRGILGGGYNDMFGYSWSLDVAPNAFGNNGEADLVVQAHDLYVSKFLPNLGTGPRSITPHLNVTFFAYLVDVRHPTLHPIAVIGDFFGSHEDTYIPFISVDYPTGVWYSSFPLSSSGPYNTSSYTDTPRQINFVYNPTWQFAFYRMMVSSQNWIKTIRDINTAKINNCGGNICPEAGYSEDVNDYKLKYAGVIAEVFLGDDQSDGSIGNSQKDQLDVRLNFSKVGIFHRLP